MKRFLKSIALFAVLLVVFYPAALFLWGMLAPSFIKSNLNYPLAYSGHSFTRFKEVKHVSSVDVLFLGSSLAYRGFDTRIFESDGLSSFNLGSSNQTPVQTKVLLNRYLHQLNPKVIVYEVQPEVFSVDGVESALDILANDQNDLHSVKMALNLNHIKVYNTLLYAFIRDALELNSSFEEPLSKGDDIYIAGGFVEKQMRFYKSASPEPKAWEFNPRQVSAFQEIVSRIKDLGIELILVKAPVTQSLYRSYSNNQEFDHLMRHTSTYYNFNEILSLDDSLHFYDAFHLNQQGVKLFNDKLIKLMSANCRFHKNSTVILENQH